MAISADSCADELQRLVQLHNKDVITLPYADFYRLTDRERIKEAFKADLTKRLRGRGYLVHYGEAVVLVAKDFNFSPVKLG